MTREEAAANLLEYLRENEMQGSVWATALAVAISALREQSNATQRVANTDNALTNADHIRSMTDEELAKFLDDSNSQGCVCPTKDCEATCEQCIVNWLKQPFKEDT